MKKIAKKTQTETKTNKKNIFLLTKDEIEMVHGGQGVIVQVAGGTTFYP